MNGCPICGASVPESATDCPSCHLDAALFAPVREAASMSRDHDPVYYRTIAELFRSADLLGPVSAPIEAEPPARSAVPRLPPGEATLTARPGAAAPAVPLLPLPPVPVLPKGDALRSRAHEYRLLAGPLRAPMPTLVERADAAVESGDEPALAAVAKEMFVHLAGALVAAYDAEAAHRNELAGRVPTTAADRELEALRVALEASDLTAAGAALGRAREEIARLDEGWATERILLTECDLLAETIRELGGDPTPALGPLREGRTEADGRPAEMTELVLAQTTYALWVILEPRFTDELRRIRDRLVDQRNGGADVAPALARLRTVAAEVRRRNFAGTVLAYRQLRQQVGGTPRHLTPASATTEPVRRSA